MPNKGKCDTADISVFSALISSLLLFLMDEFPKGATYRSLNCHRSATALIGPEISENAPTGRFFRGVFNMCPARPRYSYT